MAWRSAISPGPRRAGFGLLLLLASVSTASSLSAQNTGPTASPSNFVHENWTVRDGLPVNGVNGIVQSQDGYLWLATFDGLLRFDGVRFTIYNTGNTADLPSSRIVDLVQAGDGSLWMSTEQRELVQMKHGAFRRFAAADGLPQGGVTLLTIDEDGEPLVGTDRGLAKHTAGRFSAVGADVLDLPITTAFRDAAGVLWVGTERSGVYRVDDDRVSRFSESAGIAGAINAFAEDQPGSLWIATQVGVYRWRNGELTQVREAGEPFRAVVQSLHVSGPDTVWAGSERGVFVIEGGVLRRAAGPVVPTFQPVIRDDPAGYTWYALGNAIFQNERFVVHAGEVSSEGSGPPPYVTSMTWDHEGSLWIATNRAGMHRLKPSLFTVYSEPEGVSFRNIYAIAEDRDGALFFGTFGRGVSRLSNGRIENYPLIEGSAILTQSIMEDREGRLWIGSYFGLVTCDNPPRSCDFAGPGVIPQYVPVRAIHQDRSGSIWVASEAGLYRFRNGNWGRFDVADGAPSAWVRSIEESADGTLWMATQGGGIVGYRGGRFSHITEADGLPSNLTRSIYEDADGVLWIGTEGRGLARVVLDSAGAGPHVTVYRDRDGLFDEVIHRILPDDFGRLWMSTNRGIFWVRREELNAFARGEVSRIHSTAYTERDGLRNREANGGSHPAGIRARDGRLWFPTQDGAVVVDPARTRRNDAPPPVAIEDVIAGDSVLGAADEPLNLPRGVRDFEIAYTALSLMAPENVRFRYRLVGLNEDWVDVGGRRSAFYTNLSPGRYRFHVIASNNDGVWNEEGASLAITVPAYFWETPLWYAALLVTFALMVFGAIRWRLRAMQTRERWLTDLVEERTVEVRARDAQLLRQNRVLEAQAARLKELDIAKSRFFANISHEFRTPLTLTIGPVEDVRDGLHGAISETGARQLDLAVRNARRLLRLINQILDVARLEAGRTQLAARESDIVGFVRSQTASFAPAAERKRIKLELTLPALQVAAWFDPDLLEKVLANLLANAIKFTPDTGSVWIGVQVGHAEPGDGQDPSFVDITVRDSGPGIAPEHQERVFDRFYRVDDPEGRLQLGTGIGLSLARELTELHGGSITLRSEAGRGAEFTIRLPLGRAHLRDDQIAQNLSRTGAAEPVVAADDYFETIETPAATPADDDADSADVTTVLVVDDNAEVRAYIRSHLDRMYRVLEAGNGEEALTLARDTQPDLIISDVRMPGLDGFDLVRGLRSDPDLDFVPVILLTARADVGDRLEGLATGADDYLVKPFDMRELEARVGNLITSRLRLRKRFAHGGDRPTGTALPLQRAGASEVAPADVAFLERVTSAIAAGLEDEEFGVAELARRVAQDRSHLYRRLHELTGEGPAELVRRMRLERAAQLLGEQAGSVAEIAYGVGFKSVSHFCKVFREAHGVTPAVFARQKQQN